MYKIIISACLMGEMVKFTGGNNLVSSEILERWQKEGRLVLVCPEVEGGLPVPRNPAEIIKGTGNDVLNGAAKVIDNKNTDVTLSFLKGAKETLKKAEENSVKMAILKERSPSCGSGEIYNGGFNGTIVAGSGVTTSLLHKNGIKVFGESSIGLAFEYLQELEAKD